VGEVDGSHGRVRLAGDDVQRPGTELDVRPAERERLADPQARAGQEREKDTTDTGARVEERRQLLGLDPWARGPRCLQAPPLA
jgi:hypothetical protein